MLRFRRDDVATTPSASTGIGHRRRGPARPPRNALRRFTLVRHHNTPMASSRPALTETPAAHNQAALGTARSIPGRALASSMLDSPYQGSRTGLTPPISTPVPSTPASPYGLSSVRQPRIPTATPYGRSMDTLRITRPPRAPKRPALTCLTRLLALYITPNCSSGRRRCRGASRRRRPRATPS